MAVTLPYEFDTSGIVKVILRGVLGLLFVVVVPGIIYSLFISHRTAAAIQLLLIAAIIMYFGRLFLRNLVGSRGTITADAVEVQPGRLYGIRFAGPAGRFPMQQFAGVRVERISAPIGVQGRAHERVSLVGKDRTPDILIARTALDTGRTLGEEIARVLNLPYEEQFAPY
jgi:hypothetical protein